MLPIPCLIPPRPVSLDDRRNVALEGHGKGSKCFEQFGVWTAESSAGLVHASRTGSGCYKVSYACVCVYVSFICTQSFWNNSSFQD